MAFVINLQRTVTVFKIRTIKSSLCYSPTTTKRKMEQKGRDHMWCWCWISSIQLSIFAYLWLREKSPTEPEIDVHTGIKVCRYSHSLSNNPVYVPHFWLMLVQGHLHVRNLIAITYVSQPSVTAKEWPNKKTRNYFL